MPSTSISTNNTCYGLGFKQLSASHLGPIRGKISINGENRWGCSSRLHPVQEIIIDPRWGFTTDQQRLGKGTIQKPINRNARHSQSICTSVKPHLNMSECWCCVAQEYLFTKINSKAYVNHITQPILSLFYKTETHFTWPYCTYVMQDGAPAHRAKHTQEEEKKLGTTRLDFDWRHGSWWH